MKVPKYIKTLIKERMRAIEKFESIDFKIQDWLMKKGIDPFDKRIGEYIGATSMVICEVDTASTRLIEELEKM